MALTVKQWRRAKDITQGQMADMLNVHINTYQKWETEPGKISIENAIKIAEILQIPIDEIIFKVDSSKETA